MDRSLVRRIPGAGATGGFIAVAALLLVVAGADAKPQHSLAWSAKHAAKGKPRAALPGATVTAVASGLDNPRGLSFGPGGRLYVAEAGHGAGPGERAGSCLPPEHAGEEAFCIGFTGGIAEVGRSAAHRVISGVVSYAGEEGFAATGLDGVSAHGNGGIFGVITESILGVERIAEGGGLSAATVARAKAESGRLIQADQGGNWRAVADVGDFDFRWTEVNFPIVGVEQPPDANPYGVLAEGGRRWVADAAANIIDEVRPNGSIRVVAFIPSPEQSDSVPTCIDMGPDGALYVGELTGFGNGPGKSVVWRVTPSGSVEMWARGLTAVTGCGFGSDGRFYATEFSTLGWESFEPGTGAVVRVAPHSSSPVVVAEGLSFPNGFAAADDGSIYVSNWSVAPANSGGGPTGEVVRVTP